MWFNVTIFSLKLPKQITLDFWPAFGTYKMAVGALERAKI